MSAREPANDPFRFRDQLADDIGRALQALQPSQRFTGENRIIIGIISRLAAE